LLGLGDGRSFIVRSPPPGPETLEQRVQELEWEDVADDVLAAVQALGSRARRPGVIERAIELGGWSDTELAARAWYTGGGESSHIRSIVGTALSREHTLTQRLERLTGGRYIVRGGGESQPAWGVPYRPAASNEATVPDDAPHLVDVSGLDAATSRHMSLQDELAADLRGRGIEPLSPGTWQPQFDIAFEHAQRRYVVEVKSGAPVSPQQVRLGTGQVLEYCHLLKEGDEPRPVLLLEGEPPSPWDLLLADLRIGVICSDSLSASVTRLLQGGYGSPHERRAGG